MGFGQMRWEEEGGGRGTNERSLVCGKSCWSWVRGGASGAADEIVDATGGGGGGGGGGYDCMLAVERE
jgi:hypothetical protein